MRANYPKYSPDGRSILFVAHKNSTTQIYTMDIDGKNVKKLSGDFDRNIGNINWKGHSKGLFFQYDDKGMTKMALISLSGKVKDIVDELGDYPLEDLTAAGLTQFQGEEDMHLLMEMYIIYLI